MQNQQKTLLFLVLALALFAGIPSAFGQKNKKAKLLAEQIEELNRLNAEWKFAEVFTLSDKILQENEQLAGEDWLRVMNHNLGAAGNLFKNDLLPEMVSMIKDFLNKNTVTDQELLGDTYDTLCLYYGGQFMTEETIEYADKAIEAYSNHVPILSQKILYSGRLKGLAHLNAGNYEECERIFMELLTESERTLGKESHFYKTQTGSLGVLYRRLGNYEKAIFYYEKYDDNFNNYDKAINFEAIAIAYTFLGKYMEAEILMHKCLNLKAEIFGKNHKEYAATLLQLGFLHSSAKNYHKSVKYLEEGLETEAFNTTESPMQFNVGLITLAFVYLNTNQFELARQTLARTDDFFAENDDSAFEFFRNKLAILIRLNMCTGNFQKARHHARRLIDLHRDDIDKNFAFLSESEREKSIANFYRKQQHIIQSTALYTPSDSADYALQYDIALLYKNLQLQTSQSALAYLFQTKDSTALRAYRDLTKLSRRYAALGKKKGNDDPEMQEIQNEISAAERILVAASADYRRSRELTATTHRDIKAALAPGEAAVEFVAFDYWRNEKTDSIMYAAVILQPDAEEVAFVPLFEEKEFPTGRGVGGGGAIAQRENTDRGITPRKSGKDTLLTYKLIWSKIEPRLTGVEKVYFAPAGLLHEVDFSSIDTGDSLLLSDKYELVRLLSTRSLLTRDEEEKSNKTALVIGGADYDFIGDAAQIPQKNTAGTTFFDSIAYLDNTHEWRYLPGTRTEADAVSQTLQNDGYTVNYLHGAAATEENFKKIGSETDAPRIVHLATHGFFYADKSTKKYPAADVGYQTAADPMLRSGLVLSGANRGYSGTSTGGAEDGILTAYEIANMNLLATDLVVLSACDTGLGDLQETEGVYGLQRAFKKAGVRYLIMSLQEVPDRETTVFMDYFYKYHIDNGLPIRKAFAEAKEEMRRQANDSAAWRGFVLIE